MKIRKTRQDRRETYRYEVYLENGNGEYTKECIELKPGTDGVTEAWIKTLHSLDDHEVYLNCKNGGSTMVWFGLTWSLELYQQTVARLWRQGQTENTVVIQHIVTTGTIDERILKALEQKDNTQSALIDAVKAEVNGYGS